MRGLGCSCGVVRRCRAGVRSPGLESHLQFLLFVWGWGNCRLFPHNVMLRWHSTNRVTYVNESKSALKTFKKLTFAESFLFLGLSFLSYKLWGLVQTSGFQTVLQAGGHSRPQWGGARMLLRGQTWLLPKFIMKEDESHLDLPYIIGFSIKFILQVMI